MKMEHEHAYTHIHTQLYFRSSSAGRSSRQRRWRSHLMALLWQLLTGNTREANNYSEHIQGCSSAMVFTKMGAEIKSPPGNGTCCLRKRGHIYHVVSPLDRNEVNNPEYGQLHISEPGMAHTVSRHTARFIVLSHCYTRTRQIIQNTDNLKFSNLLKQRDTAWGLSKSRAWGRNNITIGLDSATCYTHLLGHINECIKCNEINKQKMRWYLMSNL
jgi:hypothetical protein